MAGRHFMPVIGMDDIGPEPDEVLPIFPELQVVEYKAGMDIGVLVQRFKGKHRVALKAPPCSRKSVDVPAALLRGGLRPMVVHALPSRLLAASTHDYVSGLHKDVTCSFVEDYVGPHDFPKHGLVFVSTSVLVCYMAAWRAHGVTMDFVLYLDEMHESDAATAVLRNFQVVAPGVSIYVEATATRGGGAGGTFGKPTLPAQVNDYTFVRQPPQEWNMNERGKPWSLLKTRGDFLIYEDDEADAKVICEKFRTAGVRAYRLHAKMSVADFRSVMRSVNQPEHYVGVAALVVDYSFRSGFTFPTVARIIDQCQVQYLAWERNRAVLRKRDAYLPEVYQARNRGGRVEGNPCDAWMADYIPDTVVVHLEGPEFDLACILYRMLGRMPTGWADGGMFAKGQIPAEINRVIALNQPLRAYRADQAWPGSDRAPATPPPSSPLALSPEFSPASVHADDGDSVYTLGDSESLASGMSAEQFAEMRRKRKSKPEPDLPAPPPIARLTDVGDSGFAAAFETLTGGKKRGKMKFGPYYYSVGLTEPRRGMFDSFESVLNALGSIDPVAFMRTLDAEAQSAVCYYALTAYNDALVVATAAKHVVSYVAGVESIVTAAGPDALHQWAEARRDEYVASQATAHLAFAILSSAKALVFQAMGGMETKEAVAVENMLGLLSMCMHDSTSEEAQRGRVGEAWHDPSGRYRLQISPNDWKSRLFVTFFGKSPGTIDMYYAPDDPGVPKVHTTASQLAMAALRPAGEH